MNNRHGHRLKDWTAGSPATPTGLTMTRLKDSRTCWHGAPISLAPPSTPQLVTSPTEGRGGAAAGSGMPCADGGRTCGLTAVAALADFFEKASGDGVAFGVPTVDVRACRRRGCWPVRSSGRPGARRDPSHAPGAARCCGPGPAVGL